ncbi:MAG: hypothetical protein U0359_13845 [Byssovorax sp.]
MPRPAPPAPPRDEDELPPPEEDELDAPPEVGEDDDRPGVEGEDELDALDDGGDDPLDDRAAEDIEQGDEIDPVEEDGGAADDREIDVGPLDEGIDLDDADGAIDEAGEGGEPGADIEDLDLGERRSEDDGGAEGTSDNPEDEVDEAALPELDADEDGDAGDDALADLLLDEAPAPVEPAPTEARFRSLGGAGAAVAVCALSLEGSRLAAAGERLLLVDEGEMTARRATFGAGSTSVALTGGLVLAAGPRAQLVLSADGGERASPLPGFASAGAPIDLCSTPGRLWILSNGALFCLAAPRQPPAVVRARDVLAMAGTGGTLVVLRLLPDRAGEVSGAAIERLRGDDEGPEETLLSASLRRLIARPRRRLLFAATAGGRALAVGDEASLAVSRSGGQGFELLSIPGLRALCFQGEDRQAPLFALAARAGGAPTEPAEASLLRLSPEGVLTELAVIPGALTDRAAMVWDVTRDHLWVACDAGLLALAPSPPH